MTESELQMFDFINYELSYDRSNHKYSVHGITDEVSRAAGWQDKLFMASFRFQTDAAYFMAGRQALLKSFDLMSKPAESIASQATALNQALNGFGAESLDVEIENHTSNQIETATEAKVGGGTRLFVKILPKVVGMPVEEMIANATEANKELGGIDLR